MKYCNQCGSTVGQQIPHGDNRLRYVCSHCETIHYQNPNIVTGCLVLHGSRILLCKRAIEPRIGLWTLPAGFMENAETVQQGAARETWEEACAEVEVGELYTLFNLPHISQVYMLFMAQLKNKNFASGPESLEVRLFEESEVPWGQIAFPVIEETLKLFFADRTKGSITPHSGSIERIAENPKQYRVDIYK